MQACTDIFERTGYRISGAERDKPTLGKERSEDHEREKRQRTVQSVDHTILYFGRNNGTVNFQIFSCAADFIFMKIRNKKL